MDNFVVLCISCKFGVISIKMCINMYFTAISFFIKVFLTMFTIGFFKILNSVHWIINCYREHITASRGQRSHDTHTRLYFLAFSSVTRGRTRQKLVFYFQPALLIIYQQLQVVLPLRLAVIAHLKDGL